MATPEAPKLNYTDEMGVRREAPVSKRKRNSQRVTPKRGAISESRVNSTASKNKIPFNHEKVSAPAQSNPTPQFANEMKASGFVSAPAQSSPTPSRDRAAFIVSIIGVALLSVYTTITALQWHSMQQSLELTRKSIQARERPWIGFADMQVVSSDRRPTTLTADAEVFALATIKNSGPLPAFELKARGNWLRTNTGFPDTPPYPEETWPK
ncbi:MAG: hypothetical protein M3388_05340, partial [Acidobacteriota bacterium]|nr:hypothetical protein [Acidobacteriota bacterium]